MRKTGRDNRPRVKPVQKVELSTKNTTLRFILVAACFALAGTALVYGLVNLFKTEPGWKEVEANSSTVNCSLDFKFNYYFEDSGSTSDEYRKVCALYTSAVEDAYKLFSTDVSETDLYNMHYINSHINEIIEIDETLYNAFSLVKKHNSRYVYMAPIYVEYDRIFICSNESEAAFYDPAQNSELIPYINELAAYANDPAMIDVELLGDNNIRLNVAEEYLSFAKEYEIDTFVDFHWTKNAFITDYMADLLADSSYTKGYIASYDGFTRNLDSRGTSYAYNIFDRHGNSVSIPASINYAKPISIVFMRNYPLSNEDKWHYYSFANGSIATVYLDPSDGMSKSSTDNIVSYSYNTNSCADILLQSAPVFIADEFSEDALNKLCENDVFSVWFDENSICSNEEDISLTFQNTTE